jgi:hypothetical protein
MKELAWRGGRMATRGTVVVVSLQRLSHLVFRELDRKRFSVAAIATAGIYFFSVFDLSFLFKGSLWRLGHGDIGVNFLGFLYYVRDEWRFPLLYTQNLGYPYGTNIGLTDSTPLLALVYKVLAPLFPPDFDPFALWLLLCYLLLAHGFATLLFHFGHRHILAAIAGALFAVMTPFFAVHAAFAHLEAHFLILYAVLLYFKVADDPKPAWKLVWFIPLLVGALLIGFYLLAIVCMVYACALVNAFLRFPAFRRGLLILAMLSGTAMLVAMRVAGYVPHPWPVSSGFGYYSMNLLAPVTPARVRPEGNLFFMSLAVQPDATGGQVAGFNYWGAGIFLLLCATAPAWGRRVRALLGLRLWPLTAGLLTLTVLALSNRIYVGRRLLLSYDLPAPLLSFLNQFRSSGRFFWAVSYCVIVMAVSQSLKLRPPWLASVLILGGVGLQLADSWSIRDSLQQLTRATAGQSITADRWRPIVAAHRLVALVPPAQCGGFEDLYSEIGGIAARADVPLHSVLLGRYGPSATESCRALHREVLEQGFQPNVLYVFEPEPFRSIRERPELEQSCSELDGHFLCTLQRAALSLPPLPPHPGLPLWSPPEGWRNPQQVVPFFGMGWSDVDGGEGVWSLGDRAEMFFRLASCKDATGLRLKFMTFGDPKGQTLTASANGGPAVTRYYQERQLDDLVLPVRNCNSSDPRVSVSLDIQRSLSPLQVGESGDPRPLGIYLLEAELVQKVQVNENSDSPAILVVR